MILSGDPKNRVYSKTKSFAFAADPVALFGAISDGGKRPHTLLLESADIMTRCGEKSLIVASAAMKATCRGLDVYLEALTDNGENALKVLAVRLSLFVIEADAKSIRLRFHQADAKQNLESRLLCSSSLDVLRMMTQAFELPAGILAEHFLVAGIFSYDAVDQFEDLPKAKEDELQFPDYVFWLPEQLIIIDHRLQTTQLIEHGFKESPLEKGGRGIFSLYNRKHH